MADKTIREQFEEAKTLIAQKRYLEARLLLKSINHPKSQEWLTKLDKISPEGKPFYKTPMIVGGLAIALILIFVIVGYAIVRNNQQSRLTQITNEYITLCVSIANSFGGDSTNCQSDVAELANHYPEAMITCGDQYRPSQDPLLFGACLNLNGVPTSTPRPTATIVVDECQPDSWVNRVTFEISITYVPSEINEFTIDSGIESAQSARDAIADLDYPTCAEDARNAVLDYYRLVLEAYDALKNNNTNLASARLEDAQNSIDDFNAELNHLSGN